MEYCMRFLCSTYNLYSARSDVSSRKCCSSNSSRRGSYHKSTCRSIYSICNCTHYCSSASASSFAEAADSPRTVTSPTVMLSTRLRLPR